MTIAATCSHAWSAFVVSAFAFAATAGALGGCGDPVHSNAVDALGPEKSGEHAGPTHRAGQPCLVCHGGSGPADATFTVAGTVYATRGAEDPSVGAEVRLEDGFGSKHTETTNSVGNFYVTSWTPVGPYYVEVAADGVTATMTSQIGRDGSCASCHRAPADTTHVEAVYVNEVSGAGGDGGTR